MLSGMLSGAHVRIFGRAYLLCEADTAEKHHTRSVEIVVKIYYGMPISKDYNFFTNAKWGC